MDAEEEMEMADLLTREHLIEQWTIEGQQQNKTFDCCMQTTNEDYCLQYIFLTKNVARLVSVFFVFFLSLCYSLSPWISLKHSAILWA